MQQHAHSNQGTWTPRVTTAVSSAQERDVNIVCCLPPLLTTPHENRTPKPIGQLAWHQAQACATREAQHETRQTFPAKNRENQQHSCKATSQHTS